MKGFRVLVGASLWLFAAGADAHNVGDMARQLQLQEPYMQKMDPVTAPDFVLEDAEGRKVGLTDFRGKVVILNFVYARCRDVCPIHSQLLATVQEQINTTLMRDQVQFVTIATDTEDAATTARIMEAYGKAHGLDPVNWVFLYRGSGAPDAGIKTAKAYGLEFTPTPEGEQMHGVVTHVIDEEGHLQARFHGLKFQPLHLTSYVNAVLYPDHHARRDGAGTRGTFSRLTDMLVLARAAAGPQEQWVMGLLALGLLLLLLCGIALRRLRARRKASGQHAGKAAE